jgi:hypothetical protein
MKTTWTKDEIATLLMTRDAAVERALLHLHAHQLSDEQVGRFTKHDNKVGFNKMDAGFGSRLAEWLESGKKFSPKQSAAARKLVMKYAGQLARFATEQAKNANAIVTTGEVVA